jgi:hypothetical protein
MEAVHVMCLQHREPRKPETQRGGRVLRWPSPQPVLATTPSWKGKTAPLFRGHLILRANRENDLVIGPVDWCAAERSSGSICVKEPFSEDRAPPIVRFSRSVNVEFLGDVS